MEAYENIVQELNRFLQELEADEGDILSRAEKGIRLAGRTMMQLKQRVIDKGFVSQGDERHFFKTIKPQVASRLIYYSRLFAIESKRPRSSKKAQKKYFEGHIDKLQGYFNDHLEFYHYYRRGATVFDDQFFLRGKADIRLHPDTYHFFTDREFSTSHDSSVAMIIAYDMLIVYLRKEIEALDQNRNSGGMTHLRRSIPKLFWTANKVDLIELIYALQASGAINSGTMEIKELALTFEALFDTDLGDYYRTYLELRSRKIHRTRFLDRIKAGLIQRMEDADL
ncbi:RteC domain-containing protein [Galbibacter sp. EGI 63066]|uniref:RteC domain-containing protein n=1 Tax=Galbibacter sp. EGI 63066 TaxID=2993559 RepID=UPI002248D300|nr:RteC domain-containing protein [Galbibacter sp. EGI 63066]MCX2681893.1 RteC domain-containing protein [Galbibacter sp. EGI 63066]